MKWITNSADETFASGVRLAETLGGGEILLLGGDLGAGKTVFTKGVAHGLGVSDPVTSPTFTLLCEYAGRLKLYHYDAYRLKDEREAVEAGLDEPLGQPDGVCAVEWYDNIAGLFSGRKTIKITFDRTSENTREIRIDDE